jgi:hypothetical protein
MQANFSNLKRVICAVCLSLGCLSLNHLVAQDIRIVQQRGPYYVGEPMVVQIQVNGVQVEQDVACRLNQAVLPAGIRVEGPQVGQSKSSFTQIINGRITSRESVSFKYNFQITAEQPGSVTIGPFSVEIDSKTQPVEGVEVEFEELQEDPDMDLELSLPRENIYVGEQVPLTIRWLFSGDRDGLQYAFSNLQIRSPLFEQLSFIDAEVNSRTTLSIVTAQGVVELDASVAQEQVNGRNYVVVTGQRLFIAESPGDFAHIPASCRTQRVTRWGRDIFGDPRPREVVPALARATPVSFRVLPIPRDNRPNSYAGAVGSGYTLDVSLNRSVVSVGDPIALDIKISGDGDLERVALPPLVHSLNAAQFQLPAEVPVGEVIGNVKQFKVNVRVKDAAVTQLPSIELAWFDPRQAQFVTTRSKPIALQVNEAQIVSAADVVTAPSANPSSGSEVASTPGPSTPPGLSTSLKIHAANLAIEEHLPSLVVSPGRLTHLSWLPPALYLSGIALAGLGLLVKRYRHRSPREGQRSTSLKQARISLRQAENQSLRQASDTIAAALRRLIAAWPDGQRQAADETIAECERLGYSPAQQDDAQVKAKLLAQAMQAIDNYPGK